MPTSSYVKALRVFSLLVIFFSATTPSVIYAKDVADGTNDAPVQVSPEKRDPFWPIGYVPKGVVAAPKKAAPKVERPSGKYEWSAAMKKLRISGISSKGKDEFFAVVNGKVKSVGDTVSAEYQGITYTWAVESIKPPASVKLRRVSAL